MLSLSSVSLQVRNSLTNERAVTRTATKAWRQTSLATYQAQIFFEDEIKPNKKMSAKDFWKECGFTEAQIGAKLPQLYVRLGKITAEVFEAFEAWVEKSADHSSRMKSLEAFAKSAEEVGLENAEGIVLGAKKEESVSSVEEPEAEVCQDTPKAPLVLSLNLDFFGIGEGNAVLRVDTDGTIVASNITADLWSKVAELVSKGLQA
jgi:hypothetical protein